MLEMTFRKELSADEVDLYPLAQIAVCTPLVEAEAALAVLADVLLERGIIRGHAGINADLFSVEKQVSEVEDVSWQFSVCSPPTPLEFALAWARAKTGPSVLGSLRAHIRGSLRAHIRALEEERQRSKRASDSVDAFIYAARNLTWKSPGDERLRRGMHGTPLALRAKLKPWER